MLQSWNKHIWPFLNQHRIVSIVTGHVIVLTVLGVVWVSSAFGISLIGAFAQSPCTGGDQTYAVVSGDTLGTIATRYHTSWESLAAYNKIANANIIYINEQICIPGNQAGGNVPVQVAPPSSGVTRGEANLFPYGQCTWWANQRYWQLHGIYVPWTSNSDAWEWQNRARDFHWNVSSQPTVGAIIDLQPWVQGAYSLGHVAVVEQVLSNGHVIASTMNWGVYYWRVNTVEFAPGPGVTFISY